jgi:hypothetical protein
MRRATIIHHQGFGDLFTNNPICNYYSEIYDELIVLVTDEYRKKIVDAIYSDNDKIKCEIPKFNLTFNNIDSCVVCMTKGDEHSCPRVPNQKCMYVDYSNYTDYDNIKIGCFNDFEKWSNFLYHEFSFSHAFYSYANIDMSVRDNKFSISQCEQKKMNDYQIKDYAVIHTDIDRKLNIDYSHIKTKNIYELNKKSEILIDQISILENAKEIHFIDSVYSVLIYFLSFKNKKIANIPKYLHSYVNRNRDLNIYNNPSAKNFFII